MLEKFARIESRKDNPAPGFYKTTGDLLGKSGWSVPRQSPLNWLTNKRKIEWPGPDKYETNVSSVDRKKNGKFHKNRKMFAMKEKFNVGPGQYDHQKVRNENPPEISFGKDQRVLKEKFGWTPGPGKYETPAG
jgi:hypothetical protein